MQLDPEIKDVLKKYFTFSRREYKAALAMLVITLFTWFLSDFKNNFFPRQFDSTLIMQKAAELDAIQQPKGDNETTSESHEYKPAIVIEETVLPKYFNFNPNSATEEDLKKLGLSKKQIHTIRNYITKVGEIKSKAAFKKIYGITEAQFEALEPFISLPENNPVKYTERYEKKPAATSKLSIELNTADSNALDRLPGIGMGYARRIIKYRTTLGGFIDISQLLEVYGFRETLLDSISPFLTLDVSKIKLMNINIAGVEELKTHPYLRYKVASAIVNYRLQHGRFNSIEDAKNVVLITDEVFTKIKSYISVD